MRISVIIPFKNASAHLNRCIDSCKNAPGDFQFILVDDNQTPGHDSERARNAFEEDGRFLYQLSLTPGVSGARNTGIAAAMGDWVTFLDADDELLPDAYEKITEAIRSAQGHPFVQMNHQRHYKSINKTALKYTNRSGIYTLKNMPECWCMVWNKIIKREFIEQHSIRFEPGLQCGEDELFVIEMLRHHPAIAHASKLTVALKRHFDNPDSLSRSKGKEEIRNQIASLEDELVALCADGDQKELACFLCDLIGEHWQSPIYKRILGGAE